MRRLKHVFPATFALLLAEERVKRDLEAVSLLADRPAESDIEMELAYAEASFDPTAIYSVLTDQGDLNGS